MANRPRIHMAIVEEVFSSAFFEQVGDKDLHHEAIVENNGAKNLIKEIEDSNGSDDFYDANIKMLSEMTERQVKEDEQPGGMLAEARKSTMDLVRPARNSKPENKNGARPGPDSLQTALGALERHPPP